MDVYRRFLFLRLIIAAALLLSPVADAFIEAHNVEPEEICCVESGTNISQRETEIPVPDNTQDDIPFSSVCKSNHRIASFPVRSARKNLNLVYCIFRE